MKPLLILCMLSLVVTTGKGQTYIPHYKKAGNPVSELAKDIWVIHRDKNKHYWFGSNSKGVYCYDGKTITHYTVEHGLSSDRILEIKEDDAGNIYFNTPDGISKWNGLIFTTLPAPKTGEWKLLPGDLWFKGDKGLYRYDGKKLYTLKFPKHHLEDDYYKAFPNTPIDPYDVYYIYTDRKGHVWFGTGAMGAYRYDGISVSNLYEEHLTQIKSNGGSFGIRSILQDSKGAYWLCNTKYRYDVHSAEKQKGLISYTRQHGINVTNDPRGGDRIYYQSIAEDDKGRLWLQTYRDGIYCYDGKKLTRYPVKAGNDPVNVISMYRDAEGGIWLGTENRGVYRFEGKRFTPLLSK